MSISAPNAKRMRRNKRGLEPRKKRKEETNKKRRCSNAFSKKLFKISKEKHKS